MGFERLLHSLEKINQAGVSLNLAQAGFQGHKKNEHKGNFLIFGCATCIELNIKVQNAQTVLDLASETVTLPSGVK